MESYVISLIQKKCQHKLLERNLNSLHLNLGQSKHSEHRGRRVGRERGNGVEEGGVVGGNSVGGKPMEVTLICVASLFCREREVQRGAS